MLIALPIAWNVQDKGKIVSYCQQVIFSQKELSNYGKEPSRSTYAEFKTIILDDNAEEVTSEFK